MEKIALIGEGIVLELVEELRNVHENALAAKIEEGGLGLGYLVATARPSQREFLEKFIEKLAERVGTVPEIQERAARRERLQGQVPPELRSGIPTVLLIPTFSTNVELAADIVMAVAEKLGESAPRFLQVKEEVDAVVSAIPDGDVEINPLGWVVYQPGYKGGSGSGVDRVSSGDRGSVDLPSGGSPASFSYLNGRRVGAVLRLVQEAAARGWKIFS